ncbi:hypothetical protein HF086_003073, partial [Spodoptera exigua]
MTLLENQYQLFQELERLWENFIKDGRERKSKPEYFKKAWAKLDDLWKAFQGTHEQICMEISQTDVYFTENYYEQAKGIYNKFLKAINAGYSPVSKPAVPGTSSEDKPETFVSNRQEGSAMPQPQRPEKGSYSRLDESLRKQEANFRAVVRIIANINIENMSEKWEFQDALKTLESRWTLIDTDDKKLNAVNKFGLCVNCLFSHNGKECNSKHVCRKCSQPHNTILHDALQKSRTSGSSVAIATPPRDSVTSTSHVSQEVVIMSHLIKRLPNKTFSKPSWTNIQNINLADPEFYVSRPVDLLLGADIYSNIILSGIIKGDDASQPMAQQTQLGWLLCGRAQTYHCNVIINNIQDIQQFWEIEDIAEEGEMSSEDIHCVKYFQETTRRNPEGRYEVRLPMKPNFEKHLGISKQKALAQFRNLERKFEQQENLATAYKTFMREYLDLKHMHVVNSNPTLECYLPHHGVERAESSTTKYQVVFNASSKTSTGYSLNDLMYKGPNLQQDLQSLLMKWRQYKYAFTADIEKMNRKILVNPEDSPLQRIIWRESSQQPIQTFELSTVTYGTKAAPFLAMMTLKKLAADERESFPDAAKVLEESFYMDDLVHGAHTLEQGQQLIHDLNLTSK